MTPPIRMFARCLRARRARAADMEAESVIADWAEETGLHGLAAGLRAECENTRWFTLSSFLNLLDPKWLKKPRRMIATTMSPPKRSASR